LYEALIVGGIPGEYTVGKEVRQLVLLYDGVREPTIVWDHAGPQFVDVDWAPDGSYGLIVSNRKDIFRVDPPVATGNDPHPNYKFTNLWSDCGHVQVQNCESATFYGYHVRFNPTHPYAWLSGSSLLQYDGSELSVVDEGSDIAWRALGWAPDGNKALLSALVCVDANNTGVDTACVGNLTADRLLPGRIIYADVGVTRLCEVATYGQPQFDPRKAEVNDITWHPSGDYALIYGDDNFHGDILRFDATVPPSGQGTNGCPKLENSFRWLPVLKDEGEFNGMDYNPTTGLFSVTAGAGKEYWEGNGTSFFDVFGEHDIHHTKGTIFYDVRWDPTYSYELIAGYQGILYRYVPANHALTQLTTPKPNSTEAGVIKIAGRSVAPSQFDPVQRVEVRINGPSGTGDWQPAKVTGRFRTVLNFSLDWDTNVIPEGFYQVQARGMDLAGNWSNLSNRTVHVVRSGGLEVPVFDALSPQSPTGNYSLAWRGGGAVGGGTVAYEVEESGLPASLGGFGNGTLALTQDFAFSGDERLLYNGTAHGFDVHGRKDGQYFYRVRAVLEDHTAVSAWSDATGVSVALDGDGDGFPDAAEAACGSGPADAKSTCNDLDADGIPNPADKFPYDAKENRDSDGDGVGDTADAFPVDPKDWSDSDRDGFGDNAEKRLGSDAFSASSTPQTDDDLDGCINSREADAKTDPKEYSSHPADCFTGQGGALPVKTPGFEGVLALLAIGALALRRRRP
ncbi:MAG: hypothetical protein LC624_11910, partial [Halobacteriales archaeon]|nr:hypothetical protein [Halobacteriales archaeon]